jgi:hypothetical protein
MNAVKALIKKIALTPEDHIKSIGSRLKDQLTQNGVDLNNETSQFINGRIEMLLDIKKSCQKHLGIDVAVKTERPLFQEMERKKSDRDVTTKHERPSFQEIEKQKASKKNPKCCTII